MTLPSVAPVDSRWKRRLIDLIEATSDDPPPDLAERVREQLGIDLSTRYAGIDIPHPFGKASGQLSCTAQQVQHDVAAGLAFVVLKTVIAESPGGGRTMEAWAVDERRMQVVRRDARGGRVGWSVSWHGRGWSGSLGEYAELFADAIRAAAPRDIPVIPSVKFHLPHSGEPFDDAEYGHTIASLLEVWDEVGCTGPMVLEKDFSPTLAADRRARDEAGILRWVRDVPGMVEGAAPGRTALVMKLMNALGDDTFQLAMVDAAARATPVPASLVVFNRLVDPPSGEAFGGWELSDRNLAVLEAVQASQGGEMPPLSGTGNICSGRMMMEYALRGAENGQLHTFFQIPMAEYLSRGGGRSARGLHTLLLHPQDGLAVWVRHLAEAGGIGEHDGESRFRDVIGLGAAT